jgi:hypothetical protein
MQIWGAAYSGYLSLLWLTNNPHIIRLLNERDRTH